jgi:hypothetical protein
LDKVIDCIAHADKCHALGVAASNEGYRQKCLETEGMWRDLARKRLLWLTDPNPS